MRDDPGTARVNIAPVRNLDFGSARQIRRRNAVAVPVLQFVAGQQFRRGLRRIRAVEGNLNHTALAGGDISIRRFNQNISQLRL